MKGHVTKYVKKDGSLTWYGTVEQPRDPKTGKRRQKRVKASTKKECEAQIAHMIASLESGNTPSGDAKKQTLGQYLEKWLDANSQSVRTATQRRYTDIVHQHIVPTIGHIQLTKLAPMEVQHLYATRLAAGLSPTTVALLHNVLHKALKQAMRWNLLTRNVTEAIDPPREAAPQYRVWSQEEARAFLAVANQDDYAALWRLALFTGMRRGEILGLEWQDVDLDKGVLAVSRTLVRGQGNTFEAGQPKTAHGRRSIALPPTVIDSLKAHFVKQSEAKDKAGPAYNDQGLVFANAQGNPIHPNSLANRFNRLIKQAGAAPIRFHDLRHTSATLMLANGVHPKIVQERLGHADISMTLNRYSHVTMDMQRQAADGLDALMGGGTQKPGRKQSVTKR